MEKFVAVLDFFVGDNKKSVGVSRKTSTDFSTLILLSDRPLLHSRKFHAIYVEDIATDGIWALVFTGKGALYLIHEFLLDVCHSRFYFAF